MFEGRKRRKRIERAEPLAAESADGSEVRVTGTVRVLDRTIAAPASGRVAVIYGIEARDTSPSEPGGWQLRPPYTTVDTCPFVLDCGGDLGAIVVASDFAELVDIPAVAVHDSPHWDAYCVDKGLNVGHASEAIVQPGHRITVVGVVERRLVEPGSEVGFRDSTAVIYLVGDFDHPLLVTQG